MAIFNRNYSSFIINYSFVVSGTLTTSFTDYKEDFVRYRWKVIIEYAKNIAGKENVQIYADSEKREILDIAREHKVSVGRIKLIDEYTKVQGGTIDESIATLTGKTNKEIRTTIAEQSRQVTPANIKSDKTKENSKNSIPENISEKSNPSNDNVVTDKDKSQKKPEMKNENAQGKSNNEKSNNGNSKNHGNKKW